MAIRGPADLPLVLKVDSQPLKFHAISQLGHPVILVELMEQQMEQVLRSTGDWIAQYFPLEERFAFFMTQPLQAEYPLPEDAYWIRDVKWDPATTRIDEIFGAESFLFCYRKPIFLTIDGGRRPRPNEIRSQLITPYGLRKARIRYNNKVQPVQTIMTNRDEITCTPNHPIFCNGDYVIASKCRIGDYLTNSDNKDVKIIDVVPGTANGTWSIQNTAGCQYVGTKGKEFYLAH